MSEITPARKLFDLLVTRDFDPEILDHQGKPAPDASEADIFSFDFRAESGKNYGTIVIMLGDDKDLEVYCADNVGRSMEGSDKDDWFAFLEQLKNFATRNFMSFGIKNLNRLRYSMQGQAAIKEGLFEGYYGTRKVSYMGEQTDARLVIKHNRTLGEADKRFRYVESLFIETADQERFKLPFKNLAGGRAMLEHVRQGGRPYDARGNHITEIVSEMAVLSRFNRAQHNRVFEGATQQLVESAREYYANLQETLKHLGSLRGYQGYFESWAPDHIGEAEALVENLRDLFVEQTLDARIEAALPTLAKIQQGTKMKEAKIFENWVDQISEGTWALPDTPEAQEKLNELMASELIVGPDATNATEQLYDVIGDDHLFDILNDLADRDPRANIWDDSDVQARLAELGIQTPQSTQAEPADIDQDTAPEMDEGLGYSTDPEQGKWYHEGRKAYKHGTTSQTGLIGDIARKHGCPAEWLDAFRAGYQDQEGFGKDSVDEDNSMEQGQTDELAEMLKHAGLSMDEGVNDPDYRGNYDNEVDELQTLLGQSVKSGQEVNRLRFLTNKYGIHSPEDMQKIPGIQKDAEAGYKARKSELDADLEKRNQQHMQDKLLDLQYNANPMMFKQSGQEAPAPVPNQIDVRNQSKPSMYQQLAQLKDKKTVAESVSFATTQPINSLNDVLRLAGLSEANTAKKDSGSKDRDTKDSDTKDSGTKDSTPKGRLSTVYTGPGQTFTTSSTGRVRATIDKNKVDVEPGDQIDDGDDDSSPKGRLSTVYTGPGQTFTTSSTGRISATLDKNKVDVKPGEPNVKEGSIQGGTWSASPPKPGQPSVNAPSGDPEGAPSTPRTASPGWGKDYKPLIPDTTKGSAMGVNKGGVFQADPKGTIKAPSGDPEGVKEGTPMPGQNFTTTQGAQMKYNPTSGSWQSQAPVTPNDPYTMVSNKQTMNTKDVNGAPTTSYSSTTTATDPTTGKSQTMTVNDLDEADPHWDDNYHPSSFNKPSIGPQQGGIDSQGHVQSPKIFPDVRGSYKGSGRTDGVKFNEPTGKTFMGIPYYSSKTPEKVDVSTTQPTPLGGTQSNTPGALRVGTSDRPPTVTSAGSTPTLPDNYERPAVMRGRNDPNFKGDLSKTAKPKISVKPGETMDQAIQRTQTEKEFSDFLKGQSGQQFGTKPFSATDEIPDAGDVYPESKNMPDAIDESLDSLRDVLKNAGVTVNEGVLTDSTGSTLDHIVDTFKRDVKDFIQTGNMSDDLFQALYDYYFDDMPYGTKKARTGDPYEWVADRFASDMNLEESHMAQHVNPMAECNYTMEGEYCPQHGLAECGGMSYGLGEELSRLQDLAGVETHPVHDHRDQIIQISPIPHHHDIEGTDLDPLGATAHPVADRGDIEGTDLDPLPFKVDVRGFGPEPDEFGPQMGGSRRGHEVDEGVDFKPQEGDALLARIKSLALLR